MLVGRRFSGSNSVQEDLYDWYFVFDGFEKGTEAQLIGVCGPELPVLVTGGGSTVRDAALNIFLSKAEITKEVVCCGRWTSLKGMLCGK